MKRISLMFCLWMGALLAWAGGITAELNATQIVLGNQVRLTLTYDPRVEQGVPDLTALRADFTILATQQSISYTMVNGQAQSVAQWGIALQPKHAGMLTIPAITIGSLSSAPIQLNVSPANKKATVSTADKHSLQDVDMQNAAYLSVTVDNKTPYLHQEVLYKVRLVTRHRLLDAHYQAPQVEDAILFPLGEGQQYQMTQSGVVYHVDEQIYAIFPQKSGPLQIIPPSLHALSYDVDPHSVTLHGKTVTLHVRPLPKHAKRQQWLPSKLVRLRESYDHAETHLQQGATVVRTIHLQAQGLVAQLLPEIPFPEQPELRIYPGQPEQGNVIQQGELWAKSKLSVTYVFPKPGVVTLPAIRVPWFNVKTKTIDVAELPARTYEISAATQIKTRKSLARNVQHVLLTHPSSGHRITWPFKPLTMVWGVLGLGVLGLVYGVFRWRKRASQPYRDLRAACFANDPNRAKAALVAWAKQQWPAHPINHCTDILPLLKEQDALWLALQDLLVVLYDTPKRVAWQGSILWQAIATFKQPSVTRHASQHAVPPMYPTRK